MSSPNIDFLSIYFVAASGALILVAGIIVVVIVNQRIRFRLQAEKLALAEAKEQEARQLLIETSRMRDRLEELSHQMIRMQEDDRRRISRELHDEIGQLVSGIIVKCDLMSGEMNEGGEAANLVAAIKVHAEEISGRAKTLIGTLRPASLEKTGLLPALQRLTREYEESTGTRVEFQEEPRAEELDDEQKMVVYRVVQEGLTNASKYAGASLINVALDLDGDILDVEVRDDGRGFDPGEVESRVEKGRHFGLLGMKERVKLARGEFAVASRPGAGTSLRVRIPLGNGTGEEQDEGNG